MDVLLDDRLALLLSEQWQFLEVRVIQVWKFAQTCSMLSSLNDDFRTRFQHVMFLTVAVNYTVPVDAYSREIVEVTTKFKILLQHTTVHPSKNH